MNEAEKTWLSASPGTGWTQVESGTYVYATAPAVSGPWTPTGVVEKYTQFMSGDGIHRRIRAHRDARMTPAGVALRVEAWMGSKGFTRLEFELRGQDAVQGAVVRYDIASKTLGVSREGQTQESAPTDVPADCVYLPLTRNFLGPVIAQIAEKEDGRASVVVPDLRDPSSTTLFAPLISMRTARRCDVKGSSISVGQRTWRLSLIHI